MGIGIEEKMRKITVHGIEYLCDTCEKLVGYGKTDEEATNKMNATLKKQKGWVKRNGVSFLCPCCAPYGER